MDSKKAEALLKKYFAGNTSLPEEAELKKHYSSIGSGDDSEADYFRFLNAASGRNPLGDDFDEYIVRTIQHTAPAPKRKFVRFTYWYMAASLVILLGLGILFRKEIIPENPAVVVAETNTWEDPQKAFEETKKALLLLSSNLNKGEEYAAEFSKFEESQKNVKQN